MMNLHVSAKEKRMPWRRQRKALEAKIRSFPYIDITRIVFTRVKGTVTNVDVNIRVPRPVSEVRFNSAVAVQERLKMIIECPAGT